MAACSDRASCSSARKWVPKGETGTPRVAPSGVSVISVTDRSSTTGISPKSSLATGPPLSGNAAEAAAALRASGSSQEGILISSESRMDFDGEAEVFGVVNGGATVAAFIGFEVSGVSGLATLNGVEGVALGKAGEEFVDPDCGADA